MLNLEHELLLNSLPGMAYRCEVNAPWRMHYVSPGVRFVCSFSASDFTEGGQEWGGLIHPDDLLHIDVELAAAIAEHRLFNFHYRIVDPSWGIRWLNEAGQAIYDAHGRAQALVGFIIDVTEYEQVQEQLRQAEQRYALAAKATGEIIWDRNLETLEVRRMVPENSVFYSDDPEVSSSHEWWERRVHPDDAPMVQERIDELLQENGSHWSAEYRLRRPDGTYATMFDQGFVVPSNPSEPRRMVGSMQDISDRKAAEARLEQLQAELMHISRNSAMGAMAATLAHELNQPLAAAGNYLTGSKNIVSKNLGSDHQVIIGLDEAAQQIHRAGEIIRRMRSLVRDDEARREVVSLRHVIARSKKLAVSSGACPAFALNASIPQEADGVYVDQIQIEQVLLNLFRNACEAMTGRDQPAITLSARPDARGLVEVKVSDKGGGLSSPSLDSLFTAYGDSTTGGMGVGLSISRTIIEAHGGKIWGENNADGGASFYFTVPSAFSAVSF